VRGLKLIITTLTISSVLYLSGCAVKPSSPSGAGGVAVSSSTEKSSMYYYKLGLAHLENGSMSQALFYLKKAYDLNPNNYQILNALGIAYARVGEIQKAEKFLKKAIAINPNLGEAYTNLGVLYASQQRYKEAIKYLEKAVSIDEYKNKDKALFNLALIYLKMGNPVKYEEYMKKSIAYNPYNVLAYTSLGNYYLKNKRYLNAYDVYLTALSNGLETPEILAGLGKTHYYLRNYEKAEFYLNKALKMTKNNPLLRQEIETYLAKIKRKKQLAQNYNKTNIVNEDFFIKPPQEGNKEKETKTNNETIDLSKYQPAKKPIKKKSYPRYTPPKTTTTKKKVIRYGYPTKKKTPKLYYKYYLQIGVFSNYNNALRTKRRVSALGVDAKIITEKVGNDRFYRVIIGYFKSSSEARRKKDELVKLNPFFRRAIIKYKKEGK
jgi:type IV pilus biogenesis/stability protein PilW